VAAAATRALRTLRGSYVRQFGTATNWHKLFRERVDMVEK